jgi:toxin CcdB
MAQFDLYAGIGRAGGLVVDLQADVLDRLATRMVAPLAPRTEASVMSGLTPVVDVDGTSFVVLMPEMAAVPTRVLQTRIGSLIKDHDAVKRALDILFFGI